MKKIRAAVQKLFKPFIYIFVPVFCVYFGYWLNDGEKDEKISQLNRQLSQLDQLSGENIRQQSTINKLQEALVESENFALEQKIEFQSKISALTSERQKTFEEIKLLRNALAEADDRISKLVAEGRDLRAKEEQNSAYGERLSRILRIRSSALINQITLCRKSGSRLLQFGQLRIEPSRTNLDMRSVKIGKTDLPKIGCIQGLRNLRLVDIGRQNLSFLGFLRNLRVLAITNSEIISFDFLFGLDQLEKLDLSGSTFNGVEGLELAINLRSIIFNGASANIDLKVISGLKNLENLSLNDVVLGNFHALKNLRNLHSISLKGSSVEDLSALNELDKLHRIVLNDGNVIGGPLESVENLDEVKLFLGID